MNEFDPTKPVQTRDGRKARIICTDAARGVFPIVALITDAVGYESPDNYTLEGRCYRQSVGRDNNLVNVPEEKVDYLMFSPNMPTANFQSALDLARQYGGFVIKVTRIDGQPPKVEVVQ